MLDLIFPLHVDLCIVRARNGRHGLLDGALAGLLARDAMRGALEAGIVDARHGLAVRLPRVGGRGDRGAVPPVALAVERAEADDGADAAHDGLRAQALEGWAKGRQAGADDGQVAFGDGPVDQASLVVWTGREVRTVDYTGRKRGN